MMSFDEDSLKTIVAKWVAELSGFEGVSMVTVPGTVGEVRYRANNILLGHYVCMVTLWSSLSKVAQV